MENAIRDGISDIPNRTLHIDWVAMPVAAREAQDVGCRQYMLMAENDKHGLVASLLRAYG